MLLSGDENTPPDGQLSVGVGVGDILDQTISTVAGVGLDVKTLQTVLEGDTIKSNISDNNESREPDFHVKISPNYTPIIDFRSTRTHFIVFFRL